MSARGSGSLIVPALASRRRRKGRRVHQFLVFALALAGAAGGADYLYDRMARDPVEDATAQLSGGHALAAQLILRGALLRHPEDAKAMWLLGKTDLALGEPIAAERDLRSAGMLGIEAGRLRLPLAMAMLSQRKSAAVLALLDQADADPADLPRLLIVRARASAQLNDVAAAEAALAQARRLAPTLIEVPLAAADLAWQRHNVAQAEAGADRALQLDGRSAEALTMKSQVLEQRGQRAAALELLGKAITADPKAQPTRLERARILLGLGRFEDASIDINAALAIKPKDVKANYLKTAVLIHDADYVAADVLLQRLARFMYRLPRGWYMLAMVKLHLRQLAPAAEAAEKYVGHAPGDIEGRKLLARIGLASRRPDAALAALHPALDDKSTDGELLALVGAAQAMTGLLADAEGTLSRAAVLAPTNAGVQASLGQVLLMEGNAPGAVEALERSLALAPGRADVGRQLVVAAVASGRPEQAADALASLRAQAGDSLDAGRLAAVLALAQFDFDTAADGLARLAKDHPEDASVRIQWAQVLLMQGQTGAAETALATVLAQDPAQRVALAGLSRIYERTGRVAQAARLLEAARVAAPGNQDITLDLAGLFGRNGEPGKALAVLSDRAALGEQAARADGSPAMMLARAAAEAASGQPASAKLTFETLLRSAPRQTEIVLRYAEFLAGQGDGEKAGQVLAAGLAARPGEPDLQRAVVRQRYRAAGLDAALATADALRSDRANMPGAATLRGDVLQAAGKYAEAAAALQAELAAAPSSALMIRAAGAVRAARGPIEAAMMLRGWMSGHPNDVAVLTVLAAVEDAAKSPEGSRAALEMLLAREPNDAGVMNNLARVYQQLGDVRAYPIALRAYLATFDPLIADTLGCIMLAQNRTQQALALLRYAGREVPGDMMIQLHLAQAARQAGLRDEARAILTGLAQKPFDGHAVAAQLLAGLGPT